MIAQQDYPRKPQPVMKFASEFEEHHAMIKAKDIESSFTRPPEEAKVTISGVKGKSANVLSCKKRCTQLSSNV